MTIAHVHWCFFFQNIIFALVDKFFIFEGLRYEFLNKGLGVLSIFDAVKHFEMGRVAVV